MQQHEQHKSPNEPVSNDSSPDLNLFVRIIRASKRHTRLLVLIGTVLLLLGAGTGWFVTRTLNDNLLPSGFRVMGIQAGGLDAEHTEQLIHKQINRWENTNVSFVPDRTDDSLEPLAEQMFTLKGLGVTFVADEAEAVLQEWEQGGFWTKLRLQRELKNTKIDVKYEVDEDIMTNTVIDTYGKLVNRTPTNAKVDYSNPLKPVYKGEVDGIELDEYKLEQQLKSAVDEQLLKESSNSKKSVQMMLVDDEMEPATLTLRMPLVTLPAKLTLETLQQRKPDGLLAEYTTTIADVGEGHYHNIKSSATVLNNWVLSPGQSIHYDDIVNRTSDKYGLQMAPVIEKGKLVNGLGGGLCQTSTTMYNAALLSGLDIVERHAHSLPVSYVPLGLDATYSENGPDLVISNNTEGDIVWKTKVTDDKITVQVYGQKEPGVTYETETRTVKETDPVSMYELKEVSTDLQTHVIQQGKKGYVVETYRIKRKDGYVVSREKMRTSTYRSQPERMTAPGEVHPVHKPNMP
ncbi:VanW family protein [Paenibacillus marinisediminis]